MNLHSFKLFIKKLFYPLSLIDFFFLSPMPKSVSSESTDEQCPTNSSTKSIVKLFIRVTYTQQRSRGKQVCHQTSKSRKCKLKFVYILFYYCYKTMLFMRNTTSREEKRRFCVYLKKSQYSYNHWANWIELCGRRVVHS